jgi:hypothetical protein
MAEEFRGVPLPESSRELSSAIEEAFLKLTGYPVSYTQHVWLERHAHGGMSSGGIATEFWRENGIPLLLSRFAARRGIQPDVPAAGE